MELEQLLDKIEKSYKSNNPFVVYHKPDCTQIKAFFQQDSDLYCLDDYSVSGFVFAPFDSKESAILIPEKKSEKVIIQFPEKEVNSKEIVINENLDDKKNHIKLVTKGVDFIKSNKAEKIVLSRKEKVEIDSFAISKIVKRLLFLYPKTLTYVWFHPKVGLWMGATPETLVSINNNAFKTMALAGTQPFKGSIEVDWQQKEMEEQQFVTTYIQAKLKAFKLSVSNPYTVKTGNLLHLRTDISGTLNSKTDLTFLIKSLHPTPAVCGLPKEAAQEFILKNENYNREFYTGFLGELNYNNTTNLFVNLRCMKVDKNSASVFVGGGITKDSSAANEWQETVEKSKIIKQLFNE